MKTELKNKLIKILIPGLFTVATLFIATHVFAAGLVPCEGADDCNFDAFVGLANNVMSFIIFKLPVLLLVIILAWNGVQLIIYRDRAGAIKKIKAALWNALLGYLLVVGAYLLVKTFITLLAGDNLSFKVFFN